MNERITRSDIRTLARLAAEHVTYECVGVNEGFEVLHDGCTAFIDYRCDDGTETVIVADVWDRAGHRRPDIVEALQLMLN